MADMDGVNIMLVELVIRRELAYRRKMAALQSSSDSDFCRDLRPMEVRSSSSGPSPMSNSGLSSTLSGIKRPAVENSLEFLLAPEPHEPANRIFHSFCKVCQVPCSGIFNYKQHINGRKHKLKLQELKFGQEDCDMSCGVANCRRWCDFCKIWCMNEDALKAHFEGQKHKSVVAKIELAKIKPGEIVTQQNCCELCNIRYSDEHLLKMHFNGKKHRAELQKSESARKEGKEIFEQQYRCELCNIWCPDKNALNMHLQGKKHIVQLHRVLSGKLLC